MPTDGGRAVSFRVLVFLIVLAAGWHVFLWSLGRTPELRRLAGDEQTYWAAAEIHHAGELPPVDLLWPPLYPRFLALCWELFGRPSRLAAELVQVLLLAAAAFWLARLARREGLPPAWAAAAGFALFVLPAPAAFAHYFWPEVLHLALFLGVVELLRAETPKLWKAAAAGVLIGLALLTKSLLTGFLPILLLIDFLAVKSRPFGPRKLEAEKRPGPPSRKRESEGGTPSELGSPPFPVRGRGGQGGEVFSSSYLRPASILVAMLLTITPTLMRNHAATGELTIADSSTFNLWVGINDVTRQSHVGSIAWPELQAWRASAPTFAERDALLRGRIAEKIGHDGLPAILARQLGRQYFRLFEKDSYLTDMLPHGSLAPERQGYQQIPPALASLLRGLAWGSHLLLVFLAGCGLVLAPWPRRGEPWSFAAPAFLAYNLLIFLGLHVKSRYLLQMLPFLIVAAAWAGWRLFGHFRGLQRLSRARLAAAAAAGALLLFCAAAGPWLDSLGGNTP